MHSLGGGTEAPYRVAGEETALPRARALRAARDGGPAGGEGKWAEGEGHGDGEVQGDLRLPKPEGRLGDQPPLLELEGILVSRSCLEFPKVLISS